MCPEKCYLKLKVRNKCLPWPDKIGRLATFIWGRRMWINHARRAAWRICSDVSSQQRVSTGEEAPDASISAGMEAGCRTNNMNCTQWLIWHSLDPPATKANASLVPDSIVGGQEGRAVWPPQWQVELDFFQIEAGGLS